MNPPMRQAFAVIAFLLVAATAGAQDAVIAGQVFFRESGQPLGYASVSVVSRSTQLLTGESGKFLLLAVQPGQVRLRFKRIGFAPKDTTLTLAQNDTVHIRVELSRLVIQLPAMLVSGKCTNQAPFEPRPEVLASLFDQVQQNAERVKLLAAAKPFQMQILRLRGIKGRDGKIGTTGLDTVMRPPLPEPYKPRTVVQRGAGVDAGLWVLALPELPDFADTAFANNHCLRYAGQTRFESDSVIRVDFEPVPWLDKDVDIEGSLYLRVDGYQLIGMVMKLNKVPSQFIRSGLQEVNVRARFQEFVEGIPVLSEWELTNKFRGAVPARVELGQVIGLKWMTPSAPRDTVSRGQGGRR